MPPGSSCDASASLLSVWKAGTPRATTPSPKPLADPKAKGGCRVAGEALEALEACRSRGPPDTSIKREGRPSMAAVRVGSFRFNSQPLVHPRTTHLLPIPSAVRVDGPARGPRYDGCGRRAGKVSNGLPTNILRTPFAPPGPRQQLFRVCEGGKMEEPCLAKYPVSQFGTLCWKGMAMGDLGKEQTQDPGRSLGTILPTLDPSTVLRTPGEISKKRTRPIWHSGARIASPLFRLQSSVSRG